MSSIILVDRLLLSTHIHDLNEYSVVLLTRLENKAQQQPDGTLDEGSQRIKVLFSRLYAALKQFIDSYEKRSRKAATHDVDFDSTDPSKLITKSTAKEVVAVIRDLKADFDSGLLDSATMDPDAVELEKLILLYSIVCIVINFSQFLLDSTLPLDADLAYFDKVLSSPLRIGIYTLQGFPVNSTKLLLDLCHKVSAAAQENAAPNATDIPTWVPSSLTSWYKLCAQYISPIPQIVRSNVHDFMHSPAAYLVDKEQSSRWMARRFLSSSIGLPYFYSRSRLRHNRNSIYAVQTLNVKKLGYLIHELLPSSFEVRSNGIDTVDCDYSIFPKLCVLCDADTDPKGDFPPKDLPPAPTNVQEATAMLCQLVLDEIPEYQKTVLQQIHDNRKPSWLTKYWIPIAVLVYNLPGIVDYYQTNQKEIQDWVQVNVVDVITGFWRNWVVAPVKNIISTIRHDDSSKIAVTSRESLQSDTDALENMVVDYCVDNYSYLRDKSLTPDQRQAMIDQIKDQVRDGDMSMIMKIYQDNMKHPVQSVLRGSMIRNLLIQIQKTKVDGDIALSGIDQILQSQQLVFGLVAASPACLIIWWLANTTNNYFRNGYLLQSTKEHKRSIMRSMSTLERLVAVHVHTPRKADAEVYYDNGRIYIELINARQQGISLLPSNMRSAWVRDLNDIMSTGTDDSSGLFRMATIQRIWNQYGTYIKV